MTEIVPITVKASQKLVSSWHRHLPRLQGGLFAAALAINGEIRAVAVAANPPPEWNGRRKIVIARVAVSPGTPVKDNACSRLYGSLCRAAAALGWKEAWTYTLPHEPGTSLIAAGFKHMGQTKDSADWSSPSKPNRPGKIAGPKQRWMRYL